MDNERREIKDGPEQVDKVKTIGTEQLCSSNSEFDSGYRSLSIAKPALDSVNEFGPLTEQDFLYSEAGSLEGRTDNYAQYLADEVTTKLKIDLKDINWTKFRSTLSELLQEFAIRVGNEGETQNHRDLMYWTHKWHEYVSFQCSMFTLKHLLIEYF